MSDRGPLPTQRWRFWMWPWKKKCGCSYWVEGATQPVRCRFVAGHWDQP